MSWILPSRRVPSPSRSTSRCGCFEQYWKWWVGRWWGNGWVV